MADAVAGVAALAVAVGIRDHYWADGRCGAVVVARAAAEAAHFEMMLGVIVDVVVV